MVRVACLSVLLAVNLAQWEADYRNLQAHHLVMPVLGVKSKEIIDTYNDERGGGRTHEATYILAPRGTPVVAIDNGII